MIPGLISETRLGGGYGGGKAPARKKKAAPTDPNPSGYGLDPGLMTGSTLSGDLGVLARLFGRSTSPQYYEDPSLAPLGPGVLQARARKSVQSQTAPLIAEITRALTGQGKQGAAAIGAMSSQWANKLKELIPSVDAGYAGAEGVTAAGGQALTNYLGGQGNTGFQEIADKLKQAGAPQAAFDTAQPQLVGPTATGGALAAAGTESDLAALAKEGAAEHAYAAKQPGLAGLTGLQGVKDLERQIASALSQQVGDVKAQVPGLVQQILTALQGEETNKAQLRGQGRQAAASQRGNLASLAGSMIGSGRDRDLQASLARQAVAEKAYESGVSAKEYYDKLSSDEKQYLASLGLDRQKLTQDQTQFDASYGIDKYNAKTGRINALIAAKNAGKTVDPVALYTSALTDADSFILKSLVKTTKVHSDPLDKSSPLVSKEVSPQYTLAKSRLMHRLAPYRKLGLSQTDLASLADSELRAHGIVPLKG